MDSSSHALPVDHLEQVSAWGGASGGVGYVYRPSTLPDLESVFALARSTGRSVSFRGGGNSYGDAFGNREEIVLDLSRLNRILDWDPQSGTICVEPGVTINQLWRYVLADGWWPPIVTGTARTTVGGCAAMNTHGKNSWKLGTFGDHVLAFELLLPNGETLSCSREENADLFYAVIGGFGMLGCFTSLTLQLKRVYSGLLEIEVASRPNLSSTMRYFEDNVDQADYLVGWLDALSKGRSLGRSELHRGRYLSPGEDRRPAQTMRIENQLLPDSYFGVLPKSSMWFFMRPFINNFGGRLINTAKYTASRLLSGEKGKRYLQPHAAYHFLLDYIPNWKWSYGRGGLIQYQVFIPKAGAEKCFHQLFEIGHRYRLPNYLSVMKRHKPDDFLMSYGVDGYSMAMDFRVTDRNRKKLHEMTRVMDEVVLRNDGRFYFAKDSTVRPSVAKLYLGEEKLARFFELKRRCDPNYTLQSDLWRRIFDGMYRSDDLGAARLAVHDVLQDGDYID